MPRALLLNGSLLYLNAQVLQVCVRALMKKKWFAIFLAHKSTFSSIQSTNRKHFTEQSTENSDFWREASGALCAPRVTLCTTCWALRHTLLLQAVNDGLLWTCSYCHSQPACPSLAGGEDRAPRVPRPAPPPAAASGNFLRNANSWGRFQTPEAESGAQGEGVAIWVLKSPLVNLEQAQVWETQPTGLDPHKGSGQTTSALHVFLRGLLVPKLGCYLARESLSSARFR